MPLPVLFPLHPRTRPAPGRSRPARTRSRARGGHRRATARLPRDGRAALPRAGGADRLGRAAEGGLPGRRPVHHAAAEHRVDRDRRARLERAGRSGRRRGARGARTRRPPAERPPPVWRRPSGGARRWTLLHCTSDERAGSFASRSPGWATGDPTWRATSRRFPAASSRGAAIPPRRRASGSAARFPQARFTGDLDEVLADPALDAVALATPVPTHAEHAVRVLEAGKHCFVEKPLAQSVADAERAVAAARGGRPRADGRAPARVPPRACSGSSSSSTSGELGDRIYYIYGNRLNLGKLRADENALWSLGAHDVSVVLYLAERGAVGGGRPRRVLRAGRRRGRRVLLPALPLGAGGASAPELARSAQGAPLHGGRLAPDGHVRRHGARGQADRSTTRASTRTRAATASTSPGPGTSSRPRIPNVEPLRVECEHFVECVRSGRRPRSDGASGLRVVRVLEELQRSLAASARRDIVGSSSRLAVEFGSQHVGSSTSCCPARRLPARRPRHAARSRSPSAPARHPPALEEIAWRPGTSARSTSRPTTRRCCARMPRPARSPSTCPPASSSRSIRSTSGAYLVVVDGEIEISQEGGSVSGGAGLLAHFASGRAAHDSAPSSTRGWCSCWRRGRARAIRRVGGVAGGIRRRPRRREA